MAKVIYLKEVRRQRGGWLGGFRNRLALALTVGLVILGFLFSRFQFSPFLGVP